MDNAEVPLSILQYESGFRFAIIGKRIPNEYKYIWLIIENKITDTILKI